MKCLLYGFDKKPSSTARPTTVGAETDIIIKDSCSIINPVIEFTDGLNPNYKNHNYAYIPEFGRYYFINNWTYTNRKWVASMTVDVLATYRDDIGNSEIYALRCANSDKWDLKLTDDMYPIRANPYVLIGSSSNGISRLINASDYSNGTVIVGILGKTAGNMNSGMVNYYAMSGAQYNNFKNYLFADLSEDLKNWDGAWFDFVKENMAKAYIDPMQYIVTCKWYPINIDNIPKAGLQHIKIGFYEIQNASGYPLTAGTINNSSDLCVIDIPRRRDHANYNYMYDAPYASYSLYWKPIGVIQLPLKHAAEAGDNITIQYVLDIVTGDAMITVREGQAVIVSTNVNIAVDIPLVQSSVNIQAQNAVSQSIGNAVGSAVSGVTNTVTNPTPAGVVGGIVNAVGGIANAIGSAIRASEQAKYPVISSTGGLGSLAAMDTVHSPILIVEYYETVPEDNDHRGKPCCKNIKPKDVGGYILGSDTHIAVGTADERSALKILLENGFYFE